jgi:predicted membrane-bound mannosyltransferase
MAMDDTTFEGKAQRRKAGRVYLSGSPSSESVNGSQDAALSLAGADVDAPEGEVSQEDVTPVVSQIYDGPSFGERMRYRFDQTSDYLRHMSREQWLWIGVILLATILRFWDLGAKPLHHDESMHAFFSLEFARNPASYQYDPLLHGPFQFHAEGFIFMIILAAQRIFGVGGVAGNPWINDATARILPALFGIGIVALPIGLRRVLGRYSALITGLLLAVSPAFVYFSRFLREDIYFNFFMFAMVVCAVQYAQKRTIRWMVGLFLMTVFAYATFEGTYLTLVVFLSFLAVLAVWELASSLARRLPRELSGRERLFFSRSGLLLAAGAVGGVLAYIALRIMNNLNTYIVKNMQQADVKVAQLENATVLVLLYLSIAVAVVVIGVLLWQISRDDSQVTVSRPAHSDQDEFDDEEDVFPSSRTFGQRAEAIFTAPGRWAAARRDRIDPDEQPFLHLILGISWVHWFVGIVAGWVLFVALYWVLPPGPGGNLSWGEGFQIGVGRGVWQGLYYWIQQHEVARGGQPVYYYLLLLPLYEQLAIVFGLAGAVYSLFRPTRCRLFLVWWFVVSMGLYTWAGEKMPWLSIHILLPLMLLAAVMIERIVEACIDLSWDVREQGLRALLLRPRTSASLALASAPAESAEVSGADALTEVSGAPLFRDATVRLRRVYRAVAWRVVGTIASAALALALFIPMVHSMVTLAYVEPAYGPQEMMVYVQTTTDVTNAVAKINAADQKLHGGKHQLSVWVGQGEEWPFYWYLRDYYLDAHPETYARFDPDISLPFAKDSQPPDVLILTPADAQAFMTAHPGYSAKQYKLRSWWDEAYKPLPCTPSKTVTCSSAQNWGYGVGLPNYLSYGSGAKPADKFDLGRTVNRLWNWLWYRQPLGDVNGSYDFTLVVRDGLPIQP